MSLVDPVYTRVPLGDPANTCRVHWNTTGKLNWSCPRNTTGETIGDYSSLHWNTTGGTIIAHTHMHKRVKQSSIHASSKWQDGGTRSSEWTGLWKSSFYLERNTLQCTLVPLFKRVSTSTSLCACIGYEHHYSLCVFGVAAQMKSAQVKQLSP